MCICACSFVWVLCSHICTGAHRALRMILRIIFNYSVFYLLRQSVPLNLQLAEKSSLDTHLGSWIPCLYFLSAEIITRSRPHYFMWMVAIYTQVPIFVLQMFHPLSHLPNLSVLLKVSLDVSGLVL